MDLQLCHVLTGKGLRSREEQDQTVIQNLASLVTKMRKMCPSGLRYATRYRFEAESNSRAGNADNSHSGGR